MRGFLFMGVYIVNFEKYYGITKVGKADNITNRLKSLEKVHGGVVNVCYFDCESSKESLMWEDKIHESFLLNETYSQTDSFIPYYNHKLDGDGASEFFMQDNVLERLEWIELSIKTFGYTLEYMHRVNNVLVPCSKEDYLLENLAHNGRWAVDTFWKGEEGGTDYLEDLERVQYYSTPKGKECWLKEKLTEIKKLTDAFSKEVDLANKFFPDKKSLGERRSYLSLYRNAELSIKRCKTMVMDEYVDLYNSLTNKNDKLLDKSTLSNFLKQNP